MTSNIETIKNIFKHGTRTGLLFFLAACAPSTPEVVHVGHVSGITYQPSYTTYGCTTVNYDWDSGDINVGYDPFCEVETPASYRIRVLIDDCDEPEYSTPPRNLKCTKIVDLSEQKGSQLKEGDRVGITDRGQLKPAP